MSERIPNFLFLSKCQGCGKEKIRRRDQIKRGWLGFCKSCARSGKKTSEETKRKISLSKLGKKRPDGFGEKISKTWTLERKKKTSERFSGENQWNWKGDDIGYQGLHNWVVGQLGKPMSCEFCGLNKIPDGRKIYFHWANKSGEYKRDINDWLRLCAKCHKNYDNQKPPQRHYSLAG